MPEPGRDVQASVRAPCKGRHRTLCTPRSRVCSGGGWSRSRRSSRSGLPFSGNADGHCSVPASSATGRASALVVVRSSMADVSGESRAANPRRVGGVALRDDEVPMNSLTKWVRADRSATHRELGSSMGRGVNGSWHGSPARVDYGAGAISRSGGSNLTAIQAGSITAGDGSASPLAGQAGRA